MTVKEMMEVLKQLDPNQEVSIYVSGPLEVTPVARIDIEKNGDVVIY